MVKKDSVIYDFTPGQCELQAASAVNCDGRTTPQGQFASMIIFTRSGNS